MDFKFQRKDLAEAQPQRELLIDPESPKIMYHKEFGGKIAMLLDSSSRKVVLH